MSSLPRLPEDKEKRAERAARAEAVRHRKAARKARRVEHEKRKRVAAKAGLSEPEPPTTSEEDTSSSEEDTLAAPKKRDAPPVVDPSAPKRVRSEGQASDSGRGATSTARPVAVESRSTPQSATLASKQHKRAGLPRISSSRWVLVLSVSLLLLGLWLLNSFLCARARRRGSIPRPGPGLRLCRGDRPLLRRRSSLRCPRPGLLRWSPCCLRHPPLSRRG